MAFNVFTLFAKLGIDTKDYENGLSNAEDQGRSFGASISGGLKTALGVGAAAIGAATTATVMGTKAFISGVSSVSEYGDNIDKMSQKMNLSAQAYQEWDFIMQHAGTSIESMQAGIKTLSTAAESGNKAFETLGITQEEIASMSGEELFGATISALQGVESETERTYLAGQLLGRGATELGALLNMSAEETEEMRQQVHDLGGVLSDDAVKDAAQFQDSLQNMQYAFSGMQRSMLSDFLPSFSTVMDGLSLVFSGNDVEGGMKQIEVGVQDLADNIANVAPRFIEIGGTILTALAKSITSNLPVLLESGADAIVEIGQGIIENLPAIIPAVFDLLSTIVSTIIDNADVILGAGIDIIMFLVDAIADNAADIAPAIVSLANTIVSTIYTPEVLIPLVRGGLLIITGLIEGLAQAAPELTSMIPEIIANLIVTLENVFPDLLDALGSLLGNLGLFILGAVGGIMGMSFDEVSDAWNNIGDLFENGGDYLLDLIGDLGADLLDDIFGTFDDMTSAASDAVSSLLDMFDFDWSLPQIKLPHFKITGGEAPWGFAGQGSFPSVSIQWYKKAMNAPMLLDSATIFGYAGGKALGGGEAGDEMIYGRDALMRDIADVVDARLSKINFTIPVYIGTRKIQSEIVTATAEANVQSGGR